MDKKEMLQKYEKPTLEQYGFFNLPVNADLGDSGEGGLPPDGDGSNPFQG